MSPFEAEVRRIYQQMKSHLRVYDWVSKTGLKIDIFPGVFSPAYFTDSEWFAETIPEIVGQQRFLEIGTGTGIVALFAALHGADVSATDINPDAVENARFNFKKHGIDAKTYCGDMYEPLPPEEKFDFIFWNHPFNRGDNPHEETLLKAGFDFQYGSLKKYIAEAHIYLHSSGRLLLGTGSVVLSSVETCAAMYGYSIHILKEKQCQLSPISSLETTYLLCEFV